MKLNEALDLNKAKEILERGFEEAKRLLEDDIAVESFLQRLEHKLKLIPLAGNQMSEVPLMISLVRSYIKKDYTIIPMGSIIAVVSGLLYVLSPVDLIPDFIPIAGYTDDVLVIAACLKLIRSDLDEYIEWRRANGKEIIFA